MEMLSILPVDLIRLIIDFTVENDVDIVTLCQSCKMIKEILGKRTRGLNLRVSNFKKITYPVILWYYSQNPRFFSRELYRRVGQSGDLRLIETVHSIDSSESISHCIMEGICVKGHLEAAKTAIHWIDKNNKYLIHEAVKGGNLDLVEWLSNQNCPIGNFTMILASELGFIKIVKLLISKGIPIEQNSLYEATKNGHLEMLKFITFQRDQMNTTMIEVAAFLWTYPHLNLA